MICSNCKKEVPDTKKFCPYCMMPLIDHTVKAKEDKEINRIDLSKDIKKLEPEFIKIKEERKKKREEERKRKEEEAKRLLRSEEEMDEEFTEEYDDESDEDEISGILDSLDDDELDKNDDGNILDSIFDEVLGQKEKKSSENEENLFETKSVSGVILEYEIIDNETIRLIIQIGESKDIFMVYIDPEQKLTNKLFFDLLKSLDYSDVEMKIKIRHIAKKDETLRYIVSISDGVITYRFKSL